MSCHDIGMFLDLIDKDFFCPIGGNVFNEPVSLAECGHTFCRECITKWCQNSSTCPIDRNNVNLERIVPNWPLRNMVNKKKVACSKAHEVEGSECSKSNTCEWEGQLQDISSHRDKECGFEILACRHPECYEAIQRNDIEEHEKICEYRLEVCEHCAKDSIRVLDKQAHLETCPEMLINCPQNCLAFFRRVDLQKHFQNECGMTQVDCPCAGVGCYQTITRRDLKKHLTQNFDSHFVYFSETVAGLKRQLESEKSKRKRLKGIISGLVSDLSENRSNNNNLDQKPEMVYLLGGRDFSQDYTNRFERFDPRTLIWTRMPPLRHNRVYHSTVPLHQKIYILGGRSNNEIQLKSVEIFDLTTLTWSIGPKMLSRRSSFAATVFNGRIYVVGGIENDIGVDKVEYLNVETNTWHTASSLNEKRRGHCLAVVNGKMYTLGGLGENNSSLCTVECYDPVEDIWRFDSDMLLKRDYFTTAVVGRCLYVIGGRDDAVNHLNSVECYHEETGIWRYVASMKSKRAFAGAVAIGGKIYAFGGRGNPNGLKSTNEIYDPQTDTWSLLGPMSEVCAQFSLICL
eukprot:TRINITY_DN5599_c0_g1_i1.p1 TRINITY_DN5599_c0_g1~~TRINITY_DN5599_c0_g1_i1.p1  ORF type:complete len:571 (-),score=79.06 TRINITY_DN5599_c0_g1_i1:103-1815(-)